MDIQVVFTYLPLWIMLLWIFMHKLFCGHKFSILLTIIIGEELLVVVSLTFWGSAKLFSKAAVPFYSPTINERGFQCLFILTDTIIVSLILTILVDVKWHLIAVLICISLITNEYVFLTGHIFLIIHLHVFFGKISIKMPVFKLGYWEFPGNPVVRTPCCCCWRPRFDPLFGELRSHKPCGPKKDYDVYKVGWLSQHKFSRSLHLGKNPGRNVLLNSYMFLFLRTFMTYNTNFKSIFLNFYNFNMFISRNAIYF